MNEKLPCPECGQLYLGPVGLASHRRFAHGIGGGSDRRRPRHGPVDLRCGCGYIAASTSGLGVHRRKAHGEPGQGRLSRSPDRRIGEREAERRREWTERHRTPEAIAQRVARLLPLADWVVAEVAADQAQARIPVRGIDQADRWAAAVELCRRGVTTAVEFRALSLRSALYRGLLDWWAAGGRP